MREEKEREKSAAKREKEVNGSGGREYCQAESHMLIAGSRVETIQKHETKAFADLTVFSSANRRARQLQDRQITFESRTGINRRCGH